jgi:hypothetical protein
MAIFQAPLGFQEFEAPEDMRAENKKGHSVPNGELPASLCVKRESSHIVGLDGGWNSTMDIGNWGWYE